MSGRGGGGGEWRAFPGKLLSEIIGRYVRKWSCVVNDVQFDLLISVLSFIASILWFLSGRVKLPFGFDMDEELAKAASKASFHNMLAATFTGFAALALAAKHFAPLRAWLG